jgi:L-alanine-DL-glutamate epimerase-like enolase superfamily enzyme
MESTYYGQAEDILKYPLRIEKGYMRVPEGPGLGIVVDEKKLEQLSLSEPIKV